MLLLVMLVMLRVMLVMLLVMLLVVEVMLLMLLMVVAEAASVTNLTTGGRALQLLSLRLFLQMPTPSLSDENTHAARGADPQKLLLVAQVNKLVVQFVRVAERHPCLSQGRDDVSVRRGAGSAARGGDGVGRVQDGGVLRHVRRRASREQEPRGGGRIFFRLVRCARGLGRAS